MEKCDICDRRLYFFHKKVTCSKCGKIVCSKCNTRICHTEIVCTECQEELENSIDKIRTSKTEIQNATVLEKSKKKETKNWVRRPGDAVWELKCMAIKKGYNGIMNLKTKAKGEGKNIQFKAKGIFVKIEKANS